MKFFFCYEKTSTGNWAPAIYHDDRPIVKGVNGTKVEQHPMGVIEVSEEFIGSDGQPLFGKLCKAYPLPE